MNPVRLNRLLQDAVTHHQAGRLDVARLLYDEIRQSAPKNFDAAHLAGLLALQQNRPHDAVPLLVQALRLNPRSALAEMRLGAARLALNLAAEAETHFRRALKLDPNLPEAWSHLVVALRKLGQPSEARRACEQLLRVNPTSLEARQTLATLTADLDGFAAALPGLRELASLAPHAAVHGCNLGLALITLGKLSEGAAALDRALSIDPHFAPALVGRAFALQQAHRIPEAAAAYELALAQDPKHAGAASARLLCLNYLDTVSAEQLYVEHRQFGQRIEGALPPLTHRQLLTTDRDPDRRLRLAFFSPDLRNHSVAYFLEPLLRHLDREQFEVVLYHDHFTVDATSERLRAHASLWRNFVGLPHAAVEARIRSDAPDILVDLAGHTGFNRLPLFARRLAPVQLSYLGYPNTSGLAAMDFRFTDALADPHGLADRLHSEKLIRFSSCAWVYEPPSSAPDLSTPPSASDPARPFSFGSFNNLSKVTPSTLRLWAQVIAAVPGSQLVLKGSGLDPKRLQPQLAAAGFSPAQVRLLPLRPGFAEHLASYGEIDVALDPFPYNGTTTTCEALWMGRPVVTLAGDRHAARVGASLLSAIGHADWVAQSPDDYVRIARQLSSDRSALASACLSLRDHLRASPLLDHAGQASRFGLALRQCWQNTVGADTARLSA